VLQQKCRANGRKMVAENVSEHGAENPLNWLFLDL
jgi:hypothetical protein